MDIIFSVGVLIALLILVCGAYLSIAYSYASETARPDDDPEAAKVINLSDAARDRRTDFTIGFRHQASTERKAA